MEVTSSPAHEQLIAKWFTLTRETMPGLAAKRAWPVRFDHCFQRILLDNAVGASWGEVIAPLLTGMPMKRSCGRLSL